MEFRKTPLLDLSDDGLQQVITIASGPVIIEKAKVLLDQHGNEGGLWKFPGGKVRDGASFKETARSEVKQELGIDAKLIGDPFVLRFKRLLESGVAEEILLIHYFAKRMNDVIRPDSSIEEWGWHDVDKLPENCHPNVAPVVAHFKDFRIEELKGGRR